MSYYFANKRGKHIGLLSVLQRWVFWHPVKHFSLGNFGYINQRPPRHRTSKHRWHSRIWEMWILWLNLMSKLIIFSDKFVADYFWLATRNDRLKMIQTIYKIGGRTEGRWSVRRYRCKGIIFEGGKYKDSKLSDFNIDK